MSDANTICHDVDLLGDWLDSRGYTEEAGLCLRVLGLIHEQAEENEKTKRFYIEAGFELRQLREDNKRMRAALSSIEEYIAGRVHMHNQIAGFAGSSLSGKKQRVRASEASDILGKIRAAAAALKETGDE